MSQRRCDTSATLTSTNPLSFVSSRLGFWLRTAMLLLWMTSHFPLTCWLKPFHNSNHNRHKHLMVVQAFSTSSFWNRRLRRRPWQNLGGGSGGYYYYHNHLANVPSFSASTLARMTQLSSPLTTKIPRKFTSTLASHPGTMPPLEGYYEEESTTASSGTQSPTPHDNTAQETVDNHQFWRNGHGLNDAQAEAVTQPLDAITRVVAGPGSGKTRVLTCRIAHVLQQRRPNERLLAVTFTRKAAGEMQQRLEKLLWDITPNQNSGYHEEEEGAVAGGGGVHPDLHRVTLGTFHSVCAKILRWNGDFLASLPSVQQVMVTTNTNTALSLDGGFVIVDQAEQLRILKECLADANIDLTTHKDIRPFNVLNALGSAKSVYAHGGDPFLPKEGQDQLSPLAEISSKVYPFYVQKLLTSNALDFDDLILKARELLQTQPEIRERLQRRWTHILVDEFQDTSKTQMDLVKLLTSNSLFVVGDADQSIYSWRGAHVGSLQDLSNDFDNVHTVYLMENYRSTSNIVKAAQKIISSSTTTANLRQDMKPKRGSGPAPRVIACGDDKEEAHFVIKGIKEKLESGEYTDQHEVALIYRTNAQSRVLEEACVVHNLPYVQFGSSTSFYKRQEIKDVLCYLRWLYNGNDRGSMLRVFKTPAKGMGDKAVLEFDNYCGLVSDFIANTHPGTKRPDPLEILLSMSEESQPVWGPGAPLPSDSLSTRPLKLFKEFSLQMKHLRNKAFEKPLENIILQVLQQFEIFPYLDKISKTTAEFEERKANVRELQNAAQRYTADGPCLVRKSATEGQTLDDDDENMESPLGNYLDDVALVTDMAEQGRDSEDKRFKVCLMTIHASKGMEFDTVYVVGNEDGTFPTSQSLAKGEGSVVLEEEKRLCYVAMTRAKTELILTWRREVPVFTAEGIRTVSKDRSRFLDVLVSKAGKKNGVRKGSPAAHMKKAISGTKKSLQRQNADSLSSRRRSFSTTRGEPTSSRENNSPNYRRNYSSQYQVRRSQERVMQKKQPVQRTGTQAVFSRTNPGLINNPPPPSRSPVMRAPSPSRQTKLSPSATPPKKASHTRAPVADQQGMDSTWFFPVGSKVKHIKFGEGIVLSPPPPSQQGDMPVAVQFPGNVVREFSAHGNDLSPVLA